MVWSVEGGSFSLLRVKSRGNEGSHLLVLDTVSFGNV